MQKLNYYFSQSSHNKHRIWYAAIAPLLFSQSPKTMHLFNWLKSKFCAKTDSIICNGEAIVIENEPCISDGVTMFVDLNNTGFGSINTLIANNTDSTVTQTYQFMAERLGCLSDTIRNESKSCGCWKYGDNCQYVGQFIGRPTFQLLDICRLHELCSYFNQSVQWARKHQLLFIYHGCIWLCR